MDISFYSNNKVFKLAITYFKWLPKIMIFIHIDSYLETEIYNIQILQIIDQVSWSYCRFS